MQQVLAILYMLFLWQSGFAQEFNAHYPEVRFYNLTPHIHTVFYGEQVTLFMRMTYSYLKYYQEWRLPSTMKVQPYLGVCAPFTNSKVDLLKGDCYFNLTIQGEQLGQVLNGLGLYFLHGSQKGLDSWNAIMDLGFFVTVIPHPLSMANIPSQYATANFPVYFDVKPYVNYYNENHQADASLKVDVFPKQLDGLFYDSSQLAIVGKAERTGHYQFHVIAENTYSKAAPVNLIFEVGINQHDKPIFKKNYSIADAVPGQNYQLNLLDLIEHKVHFLPHNAMTFRIDKNEPYPDWLTLGGNNKTVLLGKIPLDEAGGTRTVTLIASSNTGGDSEPLKLTIPIAIDTASKPLIDRFSLRKSAGTEFEYDVREHIFDPAHDNSLRLIIDHVEPAAPWLRISPANQTALLGTIPNEVTGQEYQVTLHVNTKTGGNSDLINIRLKIAADPLKTPRFRAANPQFPMLYPGTSFEHDFALNRDIVPDYEELPYVIELAEGYDNTPWLRIKNNRLIADLVPYDLEKQTYSIYLTIKNKPGGKSAVIPLVLFAMI